MLIAASLAKEKAERNLLILGLDERNLELLKDDKPIRKNLDDEGIPGLAEWDLIILGPEDTVRFVARFNIRSGEMKP